MNAPLTTTDHDAALDKLCADSFRAGANCGVLEAIKLLNCRGMHDAADALLTHHDSIAQRAQTYLMAEEMISRAAGKQSTD